MQVHEVVGIAGATLIIVAYLLLQTRRLHAEQPIYSLLNALGAILVIISLIYEPNTSAMIVEGFWLLISVFGLFRSCRTGGRRFSDSGAKAPETSSQ